jgi:undecaprenyl-phosphate 4-deoxy-4-formamido-L-arabinose transferase
MEQGHDLVSGIRASRKDSLFRKYASLFKRKIVAKITKINMSDDGCMLRAYSRNVIDILNETEESAVYIPALAYTYSCNPAEVLVEHEERNVGKSKYRFYDLLRLYFNLVAGYSLVPLQFFTFLGVIISILSTLFFVFLIIRRLIIGPEAQGLFTLFAIAFFLIGIVLMGMGVMGEYVGRIYQEVRKRPRFVIKRILQKEE